MVSSAVAVAAVDAPADHGPPGYAAIRSASEGAAWTGARWQGPSGHAELRSGDALLGIRTRGWHRLGRMEPCRTLDVAVGCGVVRQGLGGGRPEAGQLAQAEATGSGPGEG